jgi:nitrogen regulatory protein P-II 1
MKFKLIMTLVRPELTDEVIEVSKKQGATGHVIIPARGTGIQAAKFFGVSLEDQTDIVLLVVEEHIENNIMDAIINDFKLNEPGKGLAFVLPIDRVAGLDRHIERIKENLKNQEL